MQEREKTRCKSDMAYHCATHDTQWLDDESDRCEYKRMVDAEAAIARVRELCEAKTQEVAASDPLFGPPCALYVDDILRALDGGDT